MKYYKLFFFILVPFLLVVPLFHMNTAEITEQENRTLAKFPETTKKDNLNYEFGKEFESWLGDRFWGRDKLIDARFQTMYKINGRIENDKAFVGDDGWMFGKHGIVDVPSLEKQYAEIKRSADILKRFDDKFKGKNIPIYLVLIPDRNELYQKYWERYYTPKPKIDQNEELIKQLVDHPNIHIIYPKKEFIDAIKDDILFYKDDNHLNINGANILRRQITKIFDIDFNYSFSPVPRFHFHFHYLDLFKLPRISSDMHHFKIKINTPHKILSQHKNGWENIEIKNENFRYEESVHIFGNCYGAEVILPLIAYTYNHTYFYRTSFEEEFNNQKLLLTKRLSEKANKKIILINNDVNFLEYYLKEY